MKLFVAFFAFVAVAVAVEKEIPILRQTSDIEPNGQFRYGYETGNGIVADVQGNADAIEGSYGYSSPEGQRIEIYYIADQNGYQPRGDSIPVGPPIPPLILRALEYIRTHPTEEGRNWKKLEKKGKN